MQKAVNDVLDMKKRQWLFSSNYATDYFPVITPLIIFQ